MQAMTPIYIERPPIEEICRQAIENPRGLIRIKAPQKMGKTLLLRKTLDYARSLGYRTASIDFSEWGPNNPIFNDYDQFQRSLCAEISRCLQMEDEDIESKISKTWGITLSPRKSTNYFEKYLLLENERELVVTFDRFEVLFDKLNIFEDFCCLLRSWHEKTNSQWQNFKLILVNSTDDYPELDINHSPFNVGIGVNESTGLTGFSLSQTRELLNFYQLEDLSIANETVLQKFVDFVGGHPFLLDESFKYLRRNPTQTLQQVKEESPTQTGIFNHHLGEVLETLNSHQYLKDDYIRIIQQYPNSVNLPQRSAFNLRSLGLIKNADNGCFVSSCDLYRLYFIPSLFMQEVGQLLSDISPEITEEEAKTLVSNRLNDNLNLGNNQSKWSLVLRRNFFNGDRLFQSSRAAFFAVVDYYITDSPVGTAVLAFFEEWSNYQ
ncbi:AAA-like domain-containing protein [Microcystis aeruginosa]|jgi:hypothetical protein|uniref:AAA-like domain-containing protein n=1 Tax=Microcystis aeruginosa TaxID=1126 RepID=UPI000261D124|nr:AAA-like domain-containing protein [Microcystis aeruginosa]CCI09906.1 Genome sequencing data, contig C269 [Microcystis aeruginosa PCC 7941]